MLQARASSPSGSSKRDRIITEEEPSARGQSGDRGQKRTRVRQACNRCKARKIKCGDLRPCKNCTSLGLACRDWRPGEDPYDQPAFAHPAASSSSAVPDDLAEAWPSSAADYPFEREALYPETASTRSTTIGRADPLTETPEENGLAQRFPWPNTPYERSSHSVAWPPKPDPTRHRYLAYPYVLDLPQLSLAISRRCHCPRDWAHFPTFTSITSWPTNCFSTPSGKCSRERIRKASICKCFALENESLSPHSHGSHLSSGLGAQSGAFSDSLAADWSLGGAPSLNVPSHSTRRRARRLIVSLRCRFPPSQRFRFASSSSAETSPANALPVSTIHAAVDL